MNILILGGTVFLGRHLVSAARTASHNVTLFNRGTHQIPEQEGIETILGDRNESLDRLCNRKWDVVIDTCGYAPAVVSASAKALVDSVDAYYFISSISAYQDFREPMQDEHAAMRTHTTDGKDDYGSLKAACESAVSEIFANRAVMIRPGLIVGPNDPTDRFTYWPNRIARGGDVLAPGRPDRQIQFIDVRDLSEWIVRLLETPTGGAFNATGPGYKLTMSTFLQACETTLGSNCQFVWTDDDQLTKAGVVPFSDMPFWIPDSDADFAGFMNVDCTRARNAGLTYRLIDDTIRDTYNWDTTARDKTVQRKAGITPAREQAVLTIAATGRD